MGERDVDAHYLARFSYGERVEGSLADGKAAARRPERWHRVNPDGVDTAGFTRSCLTYQFAA
jgi:hypothetical protein